VTAVSSTANDDGLRRSGIDIPGAVWPHASVIKPFNEHNHANDMDMYMNTGQFLSTSVTGFPITGSDIVNVLKSHTFYVDNYLGSFNKAAAAGFDYDTYTGTDSIAFGGLKR